MAPPNRYNLRDRRPRPSLKTIEAGPTEPSNSRDSSQNTMASRCRLLELPNELLGMLCAQLLPPEELFRIATSNNVRREPQNTRYVRIARRTCRTLRDAASPFLLSVVTIDFASLASIERFEAISQHQDIRRGVTCIRVTCKLLDPELWKDFDAFEEQQIGWMERAVNELEWMIRDRRSKPDNPWSSRYPTMMKYFPTEESITTAEGLLETWIDMICSEEPEDAYIKQLRQRFDVVLRVGFEEWQERVKAQEYLLKDGLICTRMAIAMARMPLATKLQIVRPDTEASIIGSSPYSYKWLSGGEALLQTILKPLRKSHTDDLGVEYPPIDLLVKLIIAIHKAGVSLLALDIRVHPEKDCFTRGSGEQETRELTAAMQKLKTFIFKPDCMWKARRGKTKILANIKRLCSAITDSRSLETIAIDSLDRFTCGHCRTFDLSSLITIQSWPKLKSLQLKHVSCTTADLKEIMQSIDGGPIDFWCLDLVLDGGDWADGLDLLRGNVSSEVFLGGFISLQRHPNTGKVIEEKTFNLDFSDGPSDLIRSSSAATLIRQISLGDAAERYIKGEIAKNPLRIEEDENLPVYETEDEEDHLDQWH